MIVIISIHAEVSQKQKVIAKAVLRSIERWHYNPADINNDFSQNAFEQYIDKVDYAKRFFTREDINNLSVYKDSLDDHIMNNDFRLYENVNELLDQRIAYVQSFYKDLLEQPFNYNKKESLYVNYDSLSYCRDKEELKDRWRKLLKYQTIVRYLDIAETETPAVDSEDVEKDSSKVEYLVNGEYKKDIEEKARKKIVKRTERFLKRTLEKDEEDRFSLFLNSIINVFDPHTTYMSPFKKEDFDIDMTGKLEGIGASLQEKDGYIKVQRIIPGSASWKQKELEPEDVILKVAQGKEEPVDIVDMPLKEAVKLIRGPKGTEVRLTVRKPTGEVKVIPIIRDVVIIEESYAKAALIEDKELNEKYGYIDLPKFYRDFKNRNSRNSTSDVRDALIKLKENDIEGVILDLRNNGGGSLLDAINIAGLFIEEGPVVQVQGKFNNKRVHEDKDDAVYYDGPLVILVNSLSASASEILSAALQDYERAVIVGSEHTFGKGTVQNLIDLDKLISYRFKDLKPLGSLKMTIKKFYRVNGGSTQFKGVTPDIILPDEYSYLDIGERELENSLPWDTIQKAEIEKTEDIAKSINDIRTNSEERISENKRFESIEFKTEKLEERRENSKLELTFTEIIENRKEAKNISERLKDSMTPNEELVLTNIQYHKMNHEMDEDEKARLEDWFKKIKKDVYIDEAMNILQDI